MIIYRFAHQRYINDISGIGAKLKGGRWNLPGTAVIYCSGHISLALIEVLANTGTLEELQQFKLAEIDIAETAIHEIKLKNLKHHWWDDTDYTQWLGTEILNSNKYLLIKCPSAVIEQESNYLINPSHSLFDKIKIKQTFNFRFDKRLFKN